MDASEIMCPPLLEDILALFPLDQYVAAPVTLMDMVDSDKQKGMKVVRRRELYRLAMLSFSWHPFVGAQVPPVWQTFQQIVDAAEGKNVTMGKIERFQFYERAKKAYAIVATGETMQYGNIILKKGVIVA